MYYGARYYDRREPSGRSTFISPDTLVPDPANVWDYNRFAYARLNPLKYNDPTGHACAYATMQATPIDNGALSCVDALYLGALMVGVAVAGIALNPDLADAPAPFPVASPPSGQESYPLAEGQAHRTDFPLDGTPVSAPDGFPAQTIPGQTLHADPLPQQQIGSNIVASASDREYLARLPMRYGNRGPTTGILVVDGKEYPVVSGRSGPAANMPKGSPGFNGLTRTHAEGHAAAIMHQIGAMGGTLYINNPTGPCPGRTGCDAQLARMLPAGAKLRVVWGNMYEVHEKPYENETR